MSETAVQPNIRIELVQNPDVAYALADQTSRLPAITRHRDYYEGRHPISIPDVDSVGNPQLRELLLGLRDNMCDDVVDETVARLEVVAFTGAAQDLVLTPEDESEDNDLEDDELGEAAGQLWDANRGPARESRTYREMLWAGDAWVIAELSDDNAARWFPQQPEQMGCRYREDRADTIEVAWKLWKSGNRWRLNLYYGADNGLGQPARIERWGSRGSTNDGGAPQAKSFEPLEAYNADGTDDDGLRPDWFRNPVFHYPMGEVGQYGRSVLDDVEPLQDAVNKVLVDIIVNSEDTAQPQRYGIGVQVSRDPVTGEDKPMKRASGRRADMITTANPSAQFGQFTPTDMTQQMKVLSDLRVELARKGYLPTYTVSDASTAATSGLNLLVQEGRQVKRCKGIQRDAGWVHRELVAFGLTLEGTNTDPADLELEWESATTRDEQATWELLGLKRGIGVPDEQLLVEGGYTPEQAQDWTEKAKANAPQLGQQVGGGQPGIASVTMPGVSGGMAVPTQPAGAAAPGLPA